MFDVRFVCRFRCLQLLFFLDRLPFIESLLSEFKQTKKCTEHLFCCRLHYGLSRPFYGCRVKTRPHFPFMLSIMTTATTTKASNALNFIRIAGARSTTLCVWFGSTKYVGTLLYWIMCAAKKKKLKEYYMRISRCSAYTDNSHFD